MGGKRVFIEVPTRARLVVEIAAAILPKASSENQSAL